MKRKNKKQNTMPLIYKALMTQDGSNAPVATILENTIGSIAWEYLSPGVYKGRLVGAFSEVKTWFSHSPNGIFFMSLENAQDNEPSDSVNLKTWGFDGQPADGLIYYTPILIEVYP